MAMVDNSGVLAEVREALEGRVGGWAQDARALIARILNDPNFDAREQWQCLRNQMMPFYAKVLPSGRITLVF